MGLLDNLGPNGYLVDPIFPGPTFEIASGSDNWRQLQDRLNRTSLELPSGGTWNLDEPLLVGSGTHIVARAGATVTSTSPVNGRHHNLIRVGNADFLGGQFAIEGVTVFCADEASAYGEGTLAYTQAGTTLTWTAPGDTAGAPVSIGAVVDTATSGIFALQSGTAGRALYVIVVPNASRNSNRSRTVRVEPITGARPVTWTRSGNVVTVLEPGSSRTAGDIVQLFGAGVQGHWILRSAIPGQWTFSQTGADQGVAQSARVFSCDGLTLMLAGSTWDAGKGTLAGGMSGHANHSIWLFACNQPTVWAGRHTRTQKYAVYITGCVGLRGQGLHIFGDPLSNSDGVHLTGPLRDCSWHGARGSAGDNLTAIGTTDYIDYNVFWPSAGTTEVDSVLLSDIHGEAARFELFRLYSANTHGVRNVVIDGVSGTCDPVSPAAVGVITDTNVLQVDQGNTNIRGLTIRNVTAVRSDGVTMPAVRMSGSGLKSGIVVEQQELRTFGALTAGTVYVLCVLEDLTVSVQDGAAAFAGPGVSVSGTGRVKKLLVCGGRVTANNANGSGTRPVLVLLEAAASRVDSLQVADVEVQDVSSSGNKAALVLNQGIVSRANLRGVTMLGADAAWRTTSSANVSTTVTISDCDLDCLTTVVTDAAIAVVKWANTRVRTGTAMQLGAGGTYRVDAVGCTFDARFVRNALGSGTITVRATSSSAGTPLQIDAGTPSIRLGGDCDMAFDGALLDATVANHAPGAGFYNTGAGFGAGVGAYKRGAASWVRVAA